MIDQEKWERRAEYGGMACMIVILSPLWIPMGALVLTATLIGWVIDIIVSAWGPE